MFAEEKEVSFLSFLVLY
ncbi:aspartate kinase II [Bacillus sp. NRRL B-14911]|nr:aspartate kinase II [Bacillus sp. NRRL B-14911]